MSEVGDQVVLFPPHCDPTVNLYASFHVVKGDTLSGFVDGCGTVTCVLV